MHLKEKFVGIDELADTLGRSVGWLKRQWLTLHRKQGMPRKCPVGWIWPRASMEIWLTTARPAALVANDNAVPTTPLIAAEELDDRVSAQNAALRARYGGQA